MRLSLGSCNEESKSGEAACKLLLYGIAIAAVPNLLYSSLQSSEAKLGKQNISTKECDLGLLHCKTPL